jgi:hypothetical protein
MTKKKTNTSTSEPEKAEVEKINSIHILANWKGFAPDCRPYKPSTPQIEFSPDPLIIQVDVPLTSDLIINAQKISIQEIQGNSQDRPHFTPLGMRYIIDQFEAVMQNGHSEPDEQAPKVADDDWEDESTTTTKKEDKPTKSEDDEWEDEPEKATIEKGEDSPPWAEDEDWEGDA